MSVREVPAILGSIDTSGELRAAVLHQRVGTRAVGEEGQAHTYKDNVLRPLALKRARCGLGPYSNAGTA